GGKTTAQIKDSSSWGNHSNNEDRGSVILNSPAISGALDSWSTKNIYDLAGNVWEWTMEAYYTHRVGRSGSYYYSGSHISASYRNGYSVGDTYTDFGFRAGLYVK
ncbi:MAG: SUMF1/EgtB/PvdO family nonheme iron enzyme, partial [Clostridia bacterium]